MSQKISEMNNPQSKLPLGWQWVRLGEVCEINPCRPKGFTRSSDTPTTFVPMAAVDQKAGVIANPVVVPYSKVSKGYTYFEENDVLFAKITPCMQNGKHVIARNLIDGIGFGTTEFHVLRPIKDVLPEWVRYFIRQPYFLREATRYFTGAVGQQRVPQDFLSNYLIPLPPIEEQRRIAGKIQELMQEVERARTACERQLESAKILSASYLREVFDEEAKNWETKRLGEVCEFRKGKKPITLYEESREERFPYILIESFSGTYQKFTDDESCPKCTREDVLLVWDGARSGLCTTDLDGCIGSIICALRSKSELYSEYLFWFIRNHYKDLNKMVRGTGIPHLEKEYVYSLAVPLPPLAIQQRIATELKEKMAEVDKLHSSIGKQLEAINTFPQAILRKAFRRGL